MEKSAFRRIIGFIIVLLTFFAATLSLLAFISANFGGAFQIFAFYGLFQPLLIILNFIFLIFWILRLKIWLFLPLIALILNYEFITSVYQIPKKADETYNAGNSCIRIGTYNVQGFCHGQRPLTVSLISEFMKEKEVDILCFQELDADSVYTVDSIAKAFSFLPNRSLAQSDIPGFSLMIFSKFPIIKSRKIHFQNSENQAMWADLLINDDTIRVFNFHLQTTNFNQAKFPLIPENWLWNLSGEAQKSMTVYEVLQENFRKRTRQADLIQSEITHTKYPTLVCGDMNSNPASHTYHQIKGNLHDGFKTGGSGYEYTYMDLHKLYRIDYIFHSDHFKGSKYNSYLLDYSDHKPVIMALSLKKSI